MRSRLQPQLQWVSSGSCGISRRGKDAGSATRRGLSFGSARTGVLQRLDLEGDRLDVRIDRFIQKRALHNIELLAVPSEAVAPQGRHLVRQLVDLQLLVLELLIAMGELVATRDNSV